MLDLIERKTSVMSWPVAMNRGQNFNNTVKPSNDELVVIRRQLENVAKPKESAWQRNSKGLLCALGQFGCNDTHYSPDTIGTWKFHRVSRSR